MHISERLDRFEDEVFAALNEKRRALEEQGRDVIDLSVGTPDFAPFPHIVEAAARAVANPECWKYALHDAPALLDALVSYYERRFGVAIAPDMAMSVSGTQEGMGAFALAVANEGDTVLVPDPCYPVFRNAALLAGARIEYYPLAAEHGFLPHVADIPDEVADRARYMVVSLPANPVGSVGTSELYRELIDFARAHDILLVHDNAYADIVYDGAQTFSIFQFEGAFDTCVEFLSLSKSFNVTGARISFLVGAPDLVAAVRKLRSQTDFGMFLPVQHAAIAALTGPLDAVEHQRLQYQARRDALCDGLESVGWERPNAHGTMFVWAKLPGARTDSMAFCEELLVRAGVVVTPGASFGPMGEGYVRFALVQPPDRLRDAVRAIEQAGLC